MAAKKTVLKQLKQNKICRSYDVTGNGKKDKVKFKESGNAEDGFTIKLYINGKKKCQGYLNRNPSRGQ